MGESGGGGGGEEDHYLSDRRDMQIKDVLLSESVWKEGWGAGVIEMVLEQQFRTLMRQIN